MKASLSRKEGYLAGLFSLAAVLLLMIFRSGTMSVDSLEYAMHVMTGENMWHPHHLLYCPVGHVLWKAAGSPDVIFFMQLHNALWAGLALFLFFRVLRRHEVPPMPAAAATLALLFSYGFWTFSTMIEVYVPGIALLLAAWLCLTGSPDRGPGYLRMAAFGLLFTLGVGYHQTHIFLAPAALYYVGLRWRPYPYRAVVLGTAIGALGVVSLYLIGTYVSRGSLGLAELHDYLFFYQLHGSEEWGGSSHLSPLGLLQLTQSQVSAWLGPFHGKLALTHITGLIVTLYVIIAAFLQRKQGPPSLRAARGGLLLWLMLSYLFFWWWLPSESEFFILLFTLLILLAMLPGPLSLITGKWRRTGGLILIAGALALNIPHHFIQPFESDRHEEKGRALQAEVPGKCVVITDYDASQWLKFLGGRSRSVNAGDYIEAIRSGAKPEPLSPAARACRIVDLEYFRPDFRYMGYEMKAHPEVWIRFVRHLLHIREEGGQIRTDAFEVKSIAGIPAVRIEEGTCIFADESAILNELAALGEPYAPGMKAAMQSYLQPHP